MSSLKVQLELVRPGAKMPNKGTQHSAGYDIYAPYEFELVPNTPLKVHAGFKMKIPEDHFFMIKDRSSLAYGNVNVGGGIIDSDYRGEVSVILCYRGSQDVCKFNAGDRIAQFIILKTPAAEFVNWIDESEDDNERGTGGYGSTGK